MPKIAVVTDSSSNLSKEWKKRHHIYVVPFTIHWGSEQYADTTEQAVEKLSSWFPEREETVFASAPSVFDFLYVFNQLAGNVDGIVVPLISSGISQTVTTVQLAAHLFKRVPVEVIDTHTASVGQSLVIKAIVQAIEQGKSLREIREIGERVVRGISTYFTVENTDCLYRNGKARNLASRLNSLLQRKPILCLDNLGKIRTITYARKKQSALKYFLATMDRQGDEALLHVGIAHSCRMPEAAMFRNIVEEKFFCKEILVEPFSPALHSCLGPDAIGIAFYSE